MSEDNHSRATKKRKLTDKAGQEEYAAVNLDKPTFSQQAERPESSRHSLKRESSDINDGSRPIKPGTTIGNYVRGKQTVGKDLINDVKNFGNGDAYGNYCDGELDVRGDTKNIVEHGQNPTSDKSIFNICQAAKDGCYQLDKPGCALIINNIFNGNDPRPMYKNQYRKGAESDSEKMRRLFNFLYFGRVITKENVASDKLKEILKRFREEIKEENYSSCFIIIMSHCGKAVNSILMDDLKEVDLYNDIVYEFSKHEEVRSRPKVFLVQACRSSKGPPAVLGKLEKLPGLQDVLIGHSTSPHFVAGRDKKTGAVYFEVIDRVFRENAQAESLQWLLYKVYNDESLKKRKQYPPVEIYGFQDYRFQP